MGTSPFLNFLGKNVWMHSVHSNGSSSLSFDRTEKLCLPLERGEPQLSNEGSHVKIRAKLWPLEASKGLQNQLFWGPVFPAEFSIFVFLMGTGSYHKNFIKIA